MKMILLFAGIALFCSCNTYQYITVSSPDMMQNDRHQFVAENDTMKLTYNFNGYGGPVQLTVFNKLDKPLLIDLNRSALIVNDKAIGFYSGKVELSGSVSGTTSNRLYAPGNIRIMDGRVDVTGSLPPGVVFIPSGSYITQSPLFITEHNLDNIPEDKFQKEKYTANDLSVYKINKAEFSRESSPLVFRTYLTFVQGDAGKPEIILQHSFYVSEVKQTTAGPVSTDFGNAGDQFYVSHANKGAGVAGGVAVLAVAVTAEALAAKSKN